MAPHANRLLALAPKGTMSHQEPAIYDTSAQDAGAPSAGTAGRGGSGRRPWIDRWQRCPRGDPVVVLGSQAKDGTTSASSISISTNGSGNSAGFGSSTGSGGSGGGAATLLGSG